LREETRTLLDTFKSLLSEVEGEETKHTLTKLTGQQDPSDIQTLVESYFRLLSLLVKIKRLPKEEFLKFMECLKDEA